MPTVEKTIEVNAPLDRVYNEWTNFENFPTFMENVKEVRRVGPDLTHWVVETAGTKTEWDAQTTVEERRRIAWNARGEAGQSGEVTFDDLGPNKTRVNVKIDYKLDSKVKETGAKVLGIDDAIVKNDLQRFKDFIEGGRMGGTMGGTTGRL